MNAKAGVPIDDKLRARRRSSSTLAGSRMNTADPDASLGKQLAMSGGLAHHVAAINRLLMRGGGSPAAGLVNNLQQTRGNAYVQRVLREAVATHQPAVLPAAPVLQPPTDDLSADQRPQAAGDAGPVLTVREEFVPNEYTESPDEDLKIAYVGPGEGGGGAAPGQDQAVAAPRVRFVDRGRVGTVPITTSFLAPGDARPHAFTNGGQTGTVAWAGGGGAGPHGNQSAGSVQAQVAPVYQSRAAPPPANADAWVQAGTGTVDVIRSYVGCNAGDQGNGHYVTAGAAARFNTHETLHVNSSSGHYTTNLTPLLLRVANGATTGRGIAATEPAAITALQTAINWPTSVTAFQTSDYNDNRPMGTVDTNDLASGTYPVDAGPGTVGGKAYQHRVRLPAEPNPT